MQASDLKNLRVAIVGAGYAGAAAARAISLLGCDVQLYEQAPQIGEVGAGIGLRPATMDCFRHWGMLAAMERVTSPSAAFQILTATCDPIMEEEWPEKDTYGLTTHFVHRGDFIDALLGVLAPGMLQLGHTAERIEDHGEGATVTFTNGRQVSADLVIGADGIRSAVRAQRFSDQQPVFAGEHAYRTVIPIGASAGMVDDGKLRMYLGHGTKVYLLPLLHRQQVSFDITALSPDASWSPTVSQEEILATLEGFDPRIVAMAAGMEMDKVNLRAVYDIDPVERWHSDSVVLVGDAAHAMCHHQGQGANSAIIDVRVLADALLEAGSVPEALAHYQATRKPVTDELQRISRQGWSEDEINDVFPGQKPAGVGSRD